MNMLNICPECRFPRPTADNGVVKVLGLSENAKGSVVCGTCGNRHFPKADDDYLVVNNGKCLDCGEPTDDVCCDDCMEQAETDMSPVECCLCGDVRRHEKFHWEPGCFIRKAISPGFVGNDDQYPVCSDCWAKDGKGK